MSHHPGPHPRGLVLIELMVGLVLGMFAVLVIMQLLASSTTQQRLTSASGDAEISAALAAHVLNRELTEAGLGISAYTVLGCSLSYTTSADSAAVTLASLAPVTVNAAAIPAGDANTDTLLVFSGNSALPSEGDPITAVSAAKSFTVTTPASFNIGDFVAAAPTTRDSAASCALTLGKVTGISAFAVAVTANMAGLPMGSAVYNFGSAPVVRAYAVRNGNLTLCDYMVYNCGLAAYVGSSDVWVPVASHVASFRAQYGRDTTVASMDGVVDSYDQITPGSAADTSGVARYCGWLRVVGVRMAVVAQSQQYDKEKPTNAAPTWLGTVANTTPTSTLTTVNPVAAPINLSANAEWQYYRYKTIESTVPLRNVIWNGNQATYQNGSVAC